MRLILTKYIKQLPSNFIDEKKLACAGKVKRAKDACLMTAPF